MNSPVLKNLQQHMELCLNLANVAKVSGEVPIAALVLNQDGKIIASAHNQVEQLKNPMAHAEILALQLALKNHPPNCSTGKFLTGCSLIVNLEPCALCASAIALCRIKTLVFGALDEKSGGVYSGARIFSQPQCHHRPQIIDGIKASASQELLQSFFQQKR